MPSLPSASPFAAGDCPADKFDPDYLYFLRHLRPDGDSYVLELPSAGASPTSVIKYESPIANSDGECVSDPSPARGSTNHRTEEGDSPVEAPPSWLDSLVDIDEDYRVFLQHTRVVNDRLRLEIGGFVVDYEPDPDAAQSGGSSGVEEQSGKEAAVASSGEEENNGVDSDEPVVITPEQNACDWRADPTPGRRVEGQDDVRHHDVQPRAASSHRSQGVIWPPHINLRPDSDFKRRLMDALRKPFSRKEYLQLYDMASIRTPLVKLRQVRNDAKFYPTDEMGNSYFDHYPDLVGQVLNTSYSNGLALMRGFFFWLQNSAHDDQFCPWIDDLKEVIPLMD